jgi:hypothetical protein
MAHNSRVTDLTVKPHAKRNIQLTMRGIGSDTRRSAHQSKMNARTYSRVGHETIIPSKLNGKSENYFAAVPSIYAEGATNARRRSHNLRVRCPLRRMVMLRKTVLGLLAAVTVAAVGLATAPEASARGGFGGGGFHGGGFGGGGFRGGGFGGGGLRGGFGGGGFRAAAIGGGFRGGGFHRGFHGRGLGVGLGLGLGLAGAYAAYGYPYGYGYGYDYDPYYASYGYDDGYGYGYGGGCYIVRQRVWGPYGPAIRRVQVCN